MLKAVTIAGTLAVAMSALALAATPADAQAAKKLTRDQAIAQCLRYIDQNFPMPFAVEATRQARVNGYISCMRKAGQRP